jgi:hypothetical protein
MVAPVPPKTNTMRIATPLGYSSRPPRKMWPIVLVLALLLGLGGGAFAVAYFGKKEKEPATASDSAGIARPASPADAAIVAVATPIDAAARAPQPKLDASSAQKPAMATISIDSTPQGAEVIGPDNKLLGTTPFSVPMPISDMPLELRLELTGYKKKTKTIIVSGNAMISVILDRAPAPKGTGRRGGRKKGSGDDLMNPDDL